MLILLLTSKWMTSYAVENRLQLASQSAVKNRWNDGQEKRQMEQSTSKGGMT
jgi:hypothetical protein